MPGKRRNLNSHQKKSAGRQRPRDSSAHGAPQRLQKILAAAGLGSRRQCEELITTGRVQVDRRVVTELGTRANAAKQEIRVDGQMLPRPRLHYYAVHKPPGVLSTNRDPSGRRRVIDLLPQSHLRLFTIGRLDLNSEGLILVTNDGELANRLTHPRYGVRKTYRVQVAGRPEDDVLIKLRRGVHLAQGLARVEDVRALSHHKGSSVLELVLREGQNREIRRILARLGHKVMRLIRTAVGPIRLGNLPPGARARFPKMKSPHCGKIRKKKIIMPEHKPCTTYADQACISAAPVAENVRLARDTYRIRFSCPKIAGKILPGQFIMMRLAGCNDPILGRPLALYDIVDGPGGEPDGLDIVYLVVGKMTRRLAKLEPGAKLEIWGPLGNGFPAQQTEHLVMVAGGIGQTPFLALAREYLGLHRYGYPPRSVPKAKKVTLCYGVRSAEYLAGAEDFKRLGVDLRLSTDDGSLGHQGLVTELIEPALKTSADPCRLVCCGPEPMLKAAAEIAKRLNVPCQVSLETPMACGMGICFSCAAKIRDGKGGWDYRRTCVEGPVFNAADVEFD